MRLVHKDTQVDVKVGDIVKDHDGDKFVVCGWDKPRSSASTGRLYIREVESGYERGYYPSVFDCEWIEREDRQ